MTPPDEKHHAPNVCFACKKRKRACDKRLPWCGYCVKTRKACSYSYSLPPSVTSLSSPGTGTDRTDESFYRDETRCMPPGIPELLRSTKTAGLDAIVSVQVQRTLSRVGCSLDAISDKYFHGFFHPWLPAIEPTGFRETLAKGAASTLPASISILVLAMALVTHTVPLMGPETHSAQRKMLYESTKTLHAYVCAASSPSVALIQAMLLVASYEYACDHMDAAYVSTAVCARMGRAMGLHQCLCYSSDQQHDLVDGWASREQWNVWWGIVVLERLILCETAYSTFPKATWFPEESSPLPHDFGIHSTLIQPSASGQSTPCLRDFDAENVDSFGRQAQAAYLLEQLLETTALPPEDSTRLLRMQKLDAELHSFLGRLMSEANGLRGINCAAISTTIRAIFKLHTYDASTPNGIEWSQRSVAALESVTRITIDIARSHHKAAVPTVSITYILQEASRYMEAVGYCYRGSKSTQDLEAVHAMQKSVNQRWTPCMGNKTANRSTSKFR